MTLTATAHADSSTSVVVDASAVPDNHNLVLHWAVSTSAAPPHEWLPPPPETLPEHSHMFGDGLAARSPIPHDRPLVVHVPASTLEARPEEGGPQTLIGIIVRSGGDGGEKWLHADDGAGDLEARPLSLQCCNVATSWYRKVSDRCTDRRCGVAHVLLLLRPPPW